MRNVPTTNVSGNALIILYFVSKLVPMGIAGSAIFLGYKLFVLGVTGQASLTVDAHTVSGQLLNAAPGLFFAIGGVVALIVAIWKGSSFTFSRHDPSESFAMCQPFEIERARTRDSEPSVK